LRAFYAAKIDAVRRTVPARERAAAVKALLDDRSVALRVMAQMRAASAAFLKERHRIVRKSKREASRRESQRIENTAINSKLVV